MPKTPDRDEEPALPVTTEIGSEGGSYADAIVQVETHEGLGKIDESPSRRPPSGTVAKAVPASPDSPENGVRSPDSEDDAPA